MMSYSFLLACAALFAGAQLFGYQVQFCDRVDGSSLQCPPGLDCGSRWHCWVPCAASQAGSWYQVRAYLFAAPWQDGRAGQLAGGSLSSVRQHRCASVHSRRAAL